jgi:SAM-dependent methyltransferase
MAELNSDLYIKGGTQKDFYNENEKETCTCALCGSSNFKTIATESGLGVVACSNCSFIYTNPRAKSTEENYFGNAAIFFNEARLVFSGHKPHHRDKNYEYELKKIKKNKNSGNLLDIGCNMGFFARKAKQMGFNVEAVEPSPALAKIAAEQFGLKVHNSFLEKANLPEKHYDVITLIDVFEHVTNPHYFKRRWYHCHKSSKWRLQQIQVAVGKNVRQNRWTHYLGLL